MLLPSPLGEGGPTPKRGALSSLYGGPLVTPKRGGPTPLKRGAPTPKERGPHP